MTDLRDDLAVDSDAGRREWVRPSVQKLSAGCAEDGRGPNPDGQNAS
jgi:hypothetical protein